MKQIKVYYIFFHFIASLALTISFLINENFKVKILYYLFSMALTNLLVHISIKDIGNKLVEKKLTLLAGIISILYLIFKNYDYIYINNYLPIAVDISNAIYIVIVFTLLRLFAKKFIGIEIIGIADIKLFGIAYLYLGELGGQVALIIAFISAAFFSFSGRISGYLKKYERIAFCPFITLGICGVLNMGPIWWVKQWNGLWGSIVR